ncbi:MAG TPA: cation:proton antiporter [Bacteroidales bacterium]|nr:cation:proton antiporter [Bacteroidales bacterium]
MKYISLLLLPVFVFALSCKSASGAVPLKKDILSETLLTRDSLARDTGHVAKTHSEELAHNEEGNHSTDMSPLFFIIIALLIGAATRYLLRKTPLPFTVWLLIIGLIIGATARLGWLDSLDFINNAVSWAGHIDPHIILYVFLPTLIFEAAFAMDVHTFKKTAVNASLLAIPGIIIAMLLTGALVMGISSTGLGLQGWGWAFALMFGAVASATDPVAVVALLKELGAGKKLGTLIEGESMLNDGTAIVLFMVFLTAITGDASGASPVFEFFRVALGGILTGIIVGGVSIWWVRKVFNDALVEISVIVVAAYITFFICEHFFHVSGVLGLVALGLTMASVGKTRISPEVEKFLHDFWELFAFIANTLIFLIVGVVIAKQAAITGSNILVLIILYIGVHMIRAAVIALFYPVMKKTGYGLTFKDAVVVWYGALRGAVGLALALIVAGESRIAADIRGQFLFLTAGLVTLTLLVNATTIGWLVRKLGITRVSPAKELIRLNARKFLYNSSVNALEKSKTDRYLGRANWEAVREYLPDEVEDSELEDLQIDTIAEYRRRVLEKEKSSYWHQFKDGLMGPTAVLALSDTIEKIIDEGGLIPLSLRNDLEESWKTPKWLDLVQKVPFLASISRRYFFEMISVSYDSARAFVRAQEDSLKLVEQMSRGLAVETIGKKEEDENILETIEQEITENRMLGQTFLRNLRKNYPEIYTAVATKQAIRTLLNYERYTVEKMLRNGRLENDEAERMINEIEERMKKLIDSPPVIDIPDAENILHESYLFKNMDTDLLENIIPKFHTRIFSVGERFIKEGSTDNGLFFIARGTVIISMGDKDIDMVSKGQFIGEIAGLTGLNRTANAIAESPVTTFWLSHKDLEAAIKKHEEFNIRLWQIGGSRISENLLANTSPYDRWKKDKLKKLVQKGRTEAVEYYDYRSERDKIVILVHGNTKDKKQGSVIKAPSILEHKEYGFDKGALLFIC